MRRGVAGWGGMGEGDVVWCGGMWCGEVACDVVVCNVLVRGVAWCEVRGVARSMLRAGDER